MMCRLRHRFAKDRAFTAGVAARSLVLLSLLFSLVQAHAQAPASSPTGSPAAQNPSAGAAAPQAAPVNAPPPFSRKGAGQGQFTIRAETTEVVLYATVVDGHQQMVTNLDKSNFTVYEDGTPQTISSFREEDVPVSMGILVDNSASMQTKRAAVNRAAIDLVRASNPQDETFIVNFSDEAFLDQDFTSSIPLLQKGLSHIDSKGGTALYDAVIASADHLAKHATHPKQVIVIITDGEDNSSTATLEKTIHTVATDGPIVYAIGLLYDSSGPDAHVARKALQSLAIQTGGLAFFPKSLDQVDPIAAEVARDIREQYIIAYHPTKPISAGGYRTVRVVAHAKGHHKLTVRTRAGYFATEFSH